MIPVKQSQAGVDEVIALLAPTALETSQSRNPMDSLVALGNLATELAADGSHLPRPQQTAAPVRIFASQVMPPPSSALEAAASASATR